jgi:hypothetical protein
LRALEEADKTIVYLGQARLSNLLLLARSALLGKFSYYSFFPKSLLQTNASRLPYCSTFCPRKAETREALLSVYVDVCVTEMSMPLQSNFNQRSIDDKTKTLHKDNEIFFYFVFSGFVVLVTWVYFYLILLAYVFPHYLFIFVSMP